jgi:small subunit ribosomal protein S1
MFVTKRRSAAPGERSEVTQMAKAGSTSIKADEPQTMEELLKSFGDKPMGLSKSQTLDGKIVSVNPKEIVVDVGAKSEGIISGRELDAVRDYMKEYKIGDTVTVTVIQPENDMGQVMLSLRQASGEKRWQTFYEKFELEEAMDVNGI